MTAIILLVALAGATLGGVLGAFLTTLAFTKEEAGLTVTLRRYLEGRMRGPIGLLGLPVIRPKGDDGATWEFIVLFTAPQSNQWQGREAS